MGGHGKHKTRYDQQMSPLDSRIHELENHLAGGDLLLGEEGEEDLMTRIQKLKGGLVFL